MMRLPKELANKISWVSSIATLLVIMIHSYNTDLYPRYGADYGIAFFIEFFLSKVVGTLAVPLFFVISGFLFFWNYGRDKVIIKYKSRVRSLLIPYLIWNLFYYIVFVLLTHCQNTSNFLQTAKVRISVLDIVEAIFLYKNNAVYWFMYQLIIFVILAPVIYYLAKTRGGQILYITLLFFIYIRYPILPPCEYGIRTDALFFWSLGAAFALKRSAFFEKETQCKPVVVGLLVILLISRLYLAAINQSLNRIPVLQEVLLIVNVLVFWKFLDILKFPDGNIFASYHFFIYSLHPLLVASLNKIVSVISPDSIIAMLGSYFLIPLISIFAIIGVAKIFMRYIPGVWNILIGGR